MFKNRAMSTRPIVIVAGVVGLLAAVRIFTVAQGAFGVVWGVSLAYVVGMLFLAAGVLGAWPGARPRVVHPAVLSTFTLGLVMFGAARLVSRGQERVAGTLAVLAAAALFGAAHARAGERQVPGHRPPAGGMLKGFTPLHAAAWGFAVAGACWTGRLVTGPADQAACARLVAPPSDWTPATFVAWFERQSATGAPSHGPAPRLTIIKFNDYQCPPCNWAYHEWDPVIDHYVMTYPQDVVYRYLDFPLSSECNPQVKTPFHPASCAAAAAVRMAALRGREAPMRRWLFDNQPHLNAEAVWGAARTVGLVADPGSEYAAALHAIEADVREAATLGVRGTPTYFINDVKVPLVPSALLDALLRAELGRGDASKGT